MDKGASAGLDREFQIGPPFGEYDHGCLTQREFPRSRTWTRNCFNDLNRDIYLDSNRTVHQSRRIGTAVEYIFTGPKPDHEVSSSSVDDLSTPSCPLNRSPMQFWSIIAMIARFSFVDLLLLIGYLKLHLFKVIN